MNDEGIYADHIDHSSNLMIGKIDDWAKNALEIDEFSTDGDNKGKTVIELSDSNIIGGNIVIGAEKELLGIQMVYDGRFRC